MNVWGFRCFYGLISVFWVALLQFLRLLMACLCGVLYCTLPSKTNSFFSPSAGGSRRPGTTGMLFTPTPWNCGQKRKKVWDAWNSRDSVRPVRPNPTRGSLLPHQDGEGKCAGGPEGKLFLLRCKSSYLLGLSQTGSRSICITSSDSLQPSTWCGTVRAFNHFQLCGLTSAASKWWWWCECFSVPDRLRSELLSPISTLQLTRPSFFSNNVVKNEPVFEENNTGSNRGGLFKRRGRRRACAFHFLV